MKILRIAVCSAAVVFLFLLSAAQAQGQTKRSGTVVDASGPLPGAVVRVSGTDTATTAGINGEFSIDAPTGAVLEITMLGYKDAVYNVGKASSGIVITLYDDATELEESVAIGYGTVKKVNLTGAVSSVSGNTLQDRTSPTLTHMLQGSVPGLYVTTYSGNPDSEAAINIRGYTSINGGGPLVLIDGIEGNLSQLNPQDFGNQRCFFVRYLRRQGGLWRAACNHSQRIFSGRQAGSPVQRQYRFLQTDHPHRL